MCEQNSLQAGDVVHFTVLDKHMEFRVARDGAPLPAKEAKASPLTFRSRGGPNSAASSTEDVLQLDEVHQAPTASSSFQTPGSITS